MNSDLPKSLLGKCGDNDCKPNELAVSLLLRALNCLRRFAWDALLATHDRLSALLGTHLVFQVVWWIAHVSQNKWGVIAVIWMLYACLHAVFAHCQPLERLSVCACCVCMCISEYVRTYVHRSFPQGRSNTPTF
jgi:hypothetical protein